MGTIPARPSNKAILEACSLLNACTPEEKTALSERSFTAYAGRGEFIWAAGDPSEFFAVLGIGFVKLTKLSHTGQEVTVELLGPGQTFGLLIALEGRRFPLSAIAVSPCWYLKIPNAVFKPMFQANPRLKDAVIFGIGPRLRTAHDMMSRFSSGRVEERIAAVLTLLIANYGQVVDAGITIPIPLTRQDLSEMAGTTVETTIRVLSKWQKLGIIRTDKQRVTVCDEPALNALLT